MGFFWPSRIKSVIYRRTISMQKIMYPSKIKNSFDITHIIGDYKAFFSDLLYRMHNIGIDCIGMPLSQLLYRVSTVTEYEQLRDQLKPFCREFVETEFNGRAVSIAILKEPLILSRGFTVSVIELPAPRLAHMYPTGLESVGIHVGSDLPEFNRKYRDVLMGIKDHGTYCKPSFVTFDNEKTVKFYDYSLSEIVLLQGWQFENLLLPATSPVNTMAETVNTWHWYVRTINDWQALTQNTIPKKTGNGLIYELANPIHNRANESFAIADMRAIKYAEPHYHVEIELYFVLQGSGTVVIGGQEKLIQKGSVLVIPSNIAHFTIPDSDLVLAVVSTPPFNANNYIILTQENTTVKFDRAKFDRLTRQ